MQKRAGTVIVKAAKDLQHKCVGTLAFVCSRTKATFIGDKVSHFQWGARRAKMLSNTEQDTYTAIPMLAL